MYSKLNLYRFQVLTIKQQKTITQWSAWSECSVSCGTQNENGLYSGGFRTRNRAKILHRFSDGRGVFAPRYDKENMETEQETCHDYPCRKLII